jgi:hypothetical protein
MISSSTRRLLWTHQVKWRHHYCHAVCHRYDGTRGLTPMTSLTKRIIQWYHYLLCHPGINRTEETISQHFYWPKMRDHIMNDVSTCAICQTHKKQSKKYGLLSEKEAEAMPWNRLCIDLIGPYNIKSNIKGVKIPLWNASLWSIRQQVGSRLNNTMTRNQ